MADPIEARGVLVCAAEESPPDAAGWRAYLDDDGAAVTFCPKCAEREFGGDAGSRKSG